MFVLPSSLWPVRHLAPWRSAEKFLEQLGDVAARTLTVGIEAKRQSGDENERKDAEALSDVVDAIIVIEALSEINSSPSRDVKSAAIRLIFKFDLRNVPDIGRLIIASEDFVSKLSGSETAVCVSGVDSVNAGVNPPSYTKGLTVGVSAIPDAKFRPFPEVKVKHRRY